MVNMFLFQAKKLKEHGTQRNGTLTMGALHERCND